ncbi:unnamed protein product [Trypanosoma congolense IL3000]|uniref:WGS project CAEQ00000000 data, annotated contig 242 n=1 Tax=Trypanosoma congolense (strain IL3000) TaxID=1068625 RepID=F9WDZ9_TRYCI|nr:unnamed protein product [Trypanosoma congolense IL3000]
MEGGGVKRTRDEMGGEAVAPVEQAEAAARDQVTAAVGPAISGDGLMQLMAMLTGMKQEMNDRIDAMNNRMDAMNNRMDAMNQEIKHIGNSVVRLEARVDTLADKGVELDGAYDSVYNARWSYVVRSDEYDTKWLGMGVLPVGEGEQPDLWSEEQADIKPEPDRKRRQEGDVVLDVEEGEQPRLLPEEQSDDERDAEEPWEGDVVPDVEGKLVMAVLSSQKGWPYMLFSAGEIQKEKAESLTEYNAVCDAYIRRENVRVWHIVKKGLVEWLNGVRVVRPFIVIGTPGIGKSFATGSLLLYQMLHYKPEWLKVVAYFVSGKAYIFHREDRRVVYYEEQTVALKKVIEMISKGVKGYIIFDMGGSGVTINHLPRSWGIVLITSPKASKFHDFAAQRYHTTPIYMNCYEDAEFKAALVWERHSQLEKEQIERENVNVENDWEVLKERIRMIGPLPRYVLADDPTYERRVTEVDGAMRSMRDDLGYYMDVLDNQSEWRKEGTTHKLVKLVYRKVKRKLVRRNRVTSLYVLKELAKKLRQAQLRRSLIYYILCGALEKCACLLEELGLDIFMFKDCVDKLVEHFEHLPHVNEAKRESVLSQAGLRGRVPTTLSEFASDGPKQKLETGRLYKPLIPNFPLVDGFFVVEGVGVKAIVLLQITKAKEHHTKKTTVREFRDYLGKVFEDWERIEGSYSWEIIYIQHVDSTAIKKRHRCASSRDAANDTDLALWDRIHQYQVTLNTDIANKVMGYKDDTFEALTINSR